MTSIQTNTYEINTPEESLKFLLTERKDKILSRAVIVANKVLQGENPREAYNTCNDNYVVHNHYHNSSWGWFYPSTTHNYHFINVDSSRNKKKKEEIPLMVAVAGAAMVFAAVYYGAQQLTSIISNRKKNEKANQDAELIAEVKQYFPNNPDVAKLDKITQKVQKILSRTDQYENKSLAGKFGFIASGGVGIAAYLHNSPEKLTWMGISFFASAVFSLYNWGTSQGTSEKNMSDAKTIKNITSQLSWKHYFS